MSLEEPKAPIVRIRKKKTKKKSKENDIVHLPVRASRQTRYSSLVPPANPQHKGRECCRHMFATCFKIPVCKLVCFRCILPTCYSGTGSDDEEASPECRDEGYHSQNRRSSEVTPVPISQGAQGGTSDTQDVEMTEMKSAETVVLIPPPRVAINDYRKDPCSSDQDQLEGATGDITYIEVESVSLHREGSPPTDDSDTIIIPKLQSRTDSKALANKTNSLKLTDRDTTRAKQIDTDYEIPIHLRFMDTTGCRIQKSEMDRGTLIVKSTTDAGPALTKVDYNDCDNNTDDSVTTHYVNEDIIMANQSSSVTVVKQENSDSGSIDYANIQGEVSAGVAQAIPHSNTPNGDIGNDVEEDEQHDYMNLTSLESQSDTKPRDKVVKVEGMVNTKSEDIIKLRKNMFSKSKKKDYPEFKVSRKESDLDSVANTKVVNHENDCITDVSKLVTDTDDALEGTVTEKVLLPMRVSIKEKKKNGSSSEGEVDDIIHELVTEEATTDQTKLI